MERSYIYRGDDLCDVLNEWATTHRFYLVWDRPHLADHDLPEAHLGDRLALVHHAGKYPAGRVADVHITQVAPDSSRITLVANLEGGGDLFAFAKLVRLLQDITMAST